MPVDFKVGGLYKTTEKFVVMFSDILNSSNDAKRRNDVDVIGFLKCGDMFTILEMSNIDTNWANEGYPCSLIGCKVLTIKEGMVGWVNIAFHTVVEVSLPP